MNRLFTSKFDEILAQSKRTIVIGLPLVVAQLAQMSMGFVDTIMAGNLSAKALAAVAVGFSLFLPLLVFNVGLMLVINPIVAHALGAKNHAAIGQNTWQALWLSQILGWLAFFVMRQAGVLMNFMNIEPEIMPVAQGYLEALSWGAPFYLAFFTLRFVNEGLSVNRPTMYIAFIGTALNVFANWVFMYGNLGVPKMGAVGCGWASTFVWVMMFIGIALFTFKNKNYHIFKLKEGFQLPSWVFVKEILRIGVPNGVSVGIEVSMFALAALLVGSIGVEAVAGHQIAINVASIAFMIPLGFANATTARVGFAVGRGDYREGQLLGFIGIALAFLIMSGTALIMFLFPKVIVEVYTDDPGVIDVAVHLLMFAALFQVSDGLQVAGLGALRGLKDTKIPMIVNVLAYWVVGVPLGYALGIIYDYGAAGIWIGLIAGLSVAAILHNVRFYYLTRGLVTQNRTVEDTSLAAKVESSTLM